MTEDQEEIVDSFSFLKGGKELAEDSKDYKTFTEIAQQHIGQAINATHVSFLLGSGCSSYYEEGNELGVPTMAPMAKKLLDNNGDAIDVAQKISQAENNVIKENFGINIDDEEYKKNLERLLELLFNVKFAISKATDEDLCSVNNTVNSVIKKIETHVLKSCTKGEFNKGDTKVLNLYKKFYQRLLLRDRFLEPPWIFTTNYDLFSETALDKAGIPYCNGFSGVIERRFNPSIYRYSLAEQIDISSKKWTTVAGFIYLCKLHGSVNWLIDDDETFFPIRELQNPVEGKEGQATLIYPTPAKHKASFGSPYSDLFREFQKQVVRDHSVLFTIGYSFGDEHINNIIFQALTIPNFRLIVFLPKDTDNKILIKMKELEDSRIWIIGSDDSSDGKKAHYFKTFVEDFMPDISHDEINKKIEAISEFKKQHSENE